MRSVVQCLVLALIAVLFFASAAAAGDPDPDADQHARVVASLADPPSEHDRTRKARVALSLADHESPAADTARAARVAKCLGSDCQCGASCKCPVCRCASPAAVPIPMPSAPVRVTVAADSTRGHVAEVILAVGQPVRVRFAGQEVTHTLPPKLAIAGGVVSREKFAEWFAAADEAVYLDVTADVARFRCAKLPDLVPEKKSLPPPSAYDRLRDRVTAGESITVYAGVPKPVGQVGEQLDAIPGEPAGVFDCYHLAGRGPVMVRREDAPPPSVQTLLYGITPNCPNGRCPNVTAR